LLHTVSWCEGVAHSDDHRQSETVTRRNFAAENRDDEIKCSIRQWLEIAGITFLKFVTA